MGINILTGANKNLIVRLTDGNTGDPFDLTNIVKIEACFKKAEGDDELELYYLKRTGDTTNGSATISNINATDVAIGFPVTGPGIPAGATVTDTSILNTGLPANTIIISTLATATATGVNLVVGDVSIVGNPILGKVQVAMKPAHTSLLEIGEEENFELNLTDSLGNVSIIQFPASLNVAESYC